MAATRNFVVCRSIKNLWLMFAPQTMQVSFYICSPANRASFHILLASFLMLSGYFRAWSHRLQRWRGYKQRENTCGRCVPARPHPHPRVCVCISIDILVYQRLEARGSRWHKRRRPQSTRTHTSTPTARIPAICSLGPRTQAPHEQTPSSSTQPKT